MIIWTKFNNFTNHKYKSISKGVTKYYRNINYIRKAIQSSAMNLEWWLLVADPLTCTNVGFGSKLLMSCWDSLLSVLMSVTAGVGNT